MLHKVHKSKNSALHGLAASLAIIFTAIGGVGASMLVGTPVQARSNVYLIPVRHDDLDLTRTKDIAILKRRIHRIAERLCDPGGVARLIERRATKRCEKDAAARALVLADRKIALVRFASRQQKLEHN
jgi:UrcA family protein